MQHQRYSKNGLLFVIFILSCWIHSTRADTQVVVWGAYQNLVPAGLTNVVAMAGGDSHFLALRADGTVKGWGFNNVYGQATVPADLTNVYAIAAGSTHSVALCGDGTVRFWGNVYSQNVTQAPLATTANMIDLALGPGAQHVLQLRAGGTPVDWGNASLTNVPANATNVIQVAAGDFYSIALRSNGTLVTWGQGSFSVAGVGGITAIASGWTHGLALRTNRTLVSLGDSYGIPAAATNIAMIACGGRHSIALRGDGKILTWGLGQPAYLWSDLTNVVAIAATGPSGMALTASDGPPLLGRPLLSPGVVGTTAQLKLRVISSMPVSYQWMFDGTNLTAGTNATLSLPNVQFSQAGTYSVIVSNAFGVVTNSEMPLQVVPALLTIPPASQTNILGANPRLSVTALGQAPLSYQWRFNGTNLPGLTNSSLTLTNVQLNQTGPYSVAVSNLHGGVVSRDAILSVVPTIITSVPTNQSSFPGGTIQFSLKVQANIPLSYQWGFKGANLSGASASSLTLTNISYGDAGVYSVVMSNTYEAITNSATLIVSPIAGWGRNDWGQSSIPDGLSNAVAIAAGSIHSAALTSDGRVTVWGGDNSRRAVPANLTNAVAISAGDWGSLALRSDGSIAAWGVSTPQTTVPSHATNVVVIAAGNSHSLALKADGSVVAWGDNNSGQTNIPAGLINVVAISTAGGVNLALTADGRVVGWGGNSNGQTNVPPNLSNVVAIAAGSIHCIALKADGTVALWGSSSYGLSKIPAEATNIVAVQAGFGHVQVLRADGKVFAWGYQYNGETNVPSGLANVSAISAGSFYNLALVSDFPSIWLPVPSAPTSLAPPREYAAGETLRLAIAGDGTRPLGFQWQLNGTNLPSATNAFLALPNLQLNQSGTYSVSVSNVFRTTASRMAITIVPALMIQPPKDQLTFPGATATFAAVMQANVPTSYQWQFNGSNLAGETTSTLTLTNVQFNQAGTYALTSSNIYGTIHTTNNLELTQVVPWGYGFGGITNLIPNLTNILAISAGGYHNLALKRDGTLVAWGVVLADEAEILPGLTNILGVAGGDYHNLALKADHTIVAWGAGLVDLGFTHNRGQSAVPLGLTNVVAIAGGSLFSMALKSDGTVTAWGENDYGQTNVPPTVTNIVKIAAGAYHGLALKADGSVVAWGRNAFGQIDVPSDLTNVVDLAGGEHVSVALKSDGTLVAWGRSIYGLTTIPEAATNVIAVACNMSANNLFLRGDGQVFGWGLNQYGELNVPAGLKNIAQISAGASHNLALVGDGFPSLLTPLANPIRTTNGFSLVIATQSGKVYALEYMNSLSDTNWTPLPLVAGTGGVMTLTDPTATASQRFYRARQW